MTAPKAHVESGFGGASEKLVFNGFVLESDEAAGGQPTHAFRNCLNHVHVFMD